MKWTALSMVVFLMFGLCLLNSKRDYSPMQETEELPSMSDRKTIEKVENRASRLLFPPNKYLVHANIISVQKDKYTERTLLRIDYVYVGEQSLIGREIELERYYRIGIGQCRFTSVNGFNPPLAVGEIAICWVAREVSRDSLTVCSGLDLAVVGGCEPIRKGILGKSHRHCIYTYDDALEYAAYWKSLYNSSNEHTQIKLLRDAVLSHNQIISDCAFDLLFARKPQGFLECFRELANDPDLPVNKRSVLEEFINGMGKRQIRETEPQPF